MILHTTNYDLLTQFHPPYEAQSNTIKQVTLFGPVCRALVLLYNTSKFLTGILTPIKNLNEYSVTNSMHFRYQTSRKPRNRRGWSNGFVWCRFTLYGHICWWGLCLHQKKARPSRTPRYTQERSSPPMKSPSWNSPCLTTTSCLTILSTNRYMDVQWGAQLAPS